MILTESQERQHRDAALEQKGGGNWCGTAHTCETGSGGTSCTTKLSCSRLGQSHFSDRCPMPLLAAKKVEIRAIVESSTDHRSPYVGGLESMGADEWRAGKSGPGALGSLSKSPTGSTSYELLSTDYHDCCDAASGR
jgi:hypothetical protein